MMGITMLQVTRNVCRKYGAKIAAVPAAFAFTLGQAHAALPEAVSTEIGTAKTDMLAAAGLVIAAMVAVWGLMKLASKFGWR
jgi:hypothetical protein